MRWIRGLTALAAILLSPLLAQAQTPQHVHLQLLSDVSAIAPGKPFHLGVKLTIDPGWHVYWTNPGDAGLPTRVTFTAPGGFTVADVQFPTPTRIEDPGNIVMFGYENSVLLTAIVTPPAQLSQDFSGKFNVSASWLVCSDVCIPGKGEDSINLPMSVTAAPANADLFDSSARQIPVDLSQCPDVQSVQSTGAPGPSGSPGAIQLTIVWKQSAPSSVQFMQELNDVYNFGPVKVDSNQNTTLIGFSVETMAAKSSAGQNITAVIGYINQAGQRRGVVVPIFNSSPAN
jgi:DsbC/DsbD-like thiol-disulfide interchange protein